LKIVSEFKKELNLFTGYFKDRSLLIKKWFGEAIVSPELKDG